MIDFVLKADACYKDNSYSSPIIHFVQYGCCTHSFRLQAGSVQQQSLNDCDDNKTNSYDFTYPMENIHEISIEEGIRLIQDYTKLSEIQQNTTER